MEFWEFGRITAGVSIASLVTVCVVSGPDKLLIRFVNRMVAHILSFSYDCQTETGTDFKIFDDTFLLFNVFLLT